MDNKKQEKQVPDLKLDEQKRISVQTRDVPLKINGQDATVTIRKLSTGVRNRIQSECSTTKILGNQPSITVNQAEIQEKILAACIVKAPFDITKVKELPADVGDYLFGEYQEFAEPSREKKD